jgi:type IX secretion system PorP/SprF family membrane protein
MLKRLFTLLLIIMVIPAYCFGQGTDTGPGYQMPMMYNPALSGGEGDGTIRLSYLNFYPGNNYNLHAAYFSYDSYFSLLHGGVGFYVSDDYLGGIVNDLRGGISYSYFLHASKELYINAGLSASVYHRGYSFDKAVLPDMIDPLGGVSLPSAEFLTNTGHTIFDIGTGFLFITGKFFGGFSISHLTEPDLSGTGFSNERLKRELLIHLSGDIDVSRDLSVTLRPVTFLDIHRSFLSTGAGAVLENNLLSVNTMLLGDNARNLNIQTGFSLKIGKIVIFYNYRFNIASGNLLVPFSLLHQTGLAVSLNNVDKNKLIKAIKFPKL